MEEGNILICHDNSAGGVDLTIKKEYTCLAVSGSKVVVLDDKKRKNLYHSVRFRIKH